MTDEFEEAPSRILRRPRQKSKGETLIRIGDVKQEKIEWLWEPYIPLGRLTMLGGDPGVGKSFITTALSAALSTGAALPGEEEGLREPMTVLLLSVEDDPADTIRPRLASMGADLCLIWISQDDIELSKVGLDDIRDMLKKSSAKLLIIDPIVAFLGPKTDMNRANEVRTIMKGLARIAREFNIGLLIVRHNRKEQAGAQSKTIYAGMGSIDFTASVRSELAVNESRSGVKFLNHIKSNAGRKGQSLTYTITSAEDGSPIFAWGDFTAWPPNGDGAKKVLATRYKNESKIQRWLFDTLKGCPNGISSVSIHSMGKVFGYSDTKLERAKKGLVVSERRGDTWYWKLDPSSKVDLSSADSVE